MEARLADPDDILVDYAISAILHFKLREEDSEYNEYAGSTLTYRKIDLKQLGKKPALGSGKDYKDKVRRYPPGLNEVIHCWLFHDVYGYSYGLSAPALNLDECLRVGEINVAIQVTQQTKLSIDTGNWLKQD